MIPTFAHTHPAAPVGDVLINTSGLFMTFICDVDNKELLVVNVGILMRLSGSFSCFEKVIS